MLTLDNGVETAVFVIKKTENDDKKMMTRKNDDIKKADSHHLQWKSASNFFQKKLFFFSLQDKLCDTVLHIPSVEVTGCVQVAGKHLLQGSVADVVALVARELWEVKRRGIVE